MRHRWAPGVTDEEHIPIGMDLSSYYNSVEWDLMEVTAQKHNSHYPCCEEPYPDVTFYFTVGL